MKNLLLCSIIKVYQCMFAAITQKLQTFINICLRRVIMVMALDSFRIKDIKE